MTKSIADRVRNLIDAYARDNLLTVEDVTDETHLAELGLDSLDVVELNVLFEDEFGVELPTLGDGISTVSDIIAQMEGLTND